LEKNPYEKEGEGRIKNGFHLHFPKLFIDPSTVKTYILPRLKNRMDSTFKNIQQENAIDQNTAKCNWLMYGSHKDGCPAYRATKCINYKLQCIPLEEGLENYRMGEESDETVRDVSEWGIIANLPRILSINSCGRERWYGCCAKQPVDICADTFAPPPAPSVKQPVRQIVREELSDRMHHCKEILPLLSVSRSDNYESWIRVCFALAYELVAAGERYVDEIL
jgi:hypothetical protein